MQVHAARLAGRCRTGSDGAGSVHHALPVGEWTALCGRTYGKLSAGWSDYYGKTVTCEACLRKMAQLAVAGEEVVLR